MITTRTWRRICYTILAVLVPFLLAVGLMVSSGLSDTAVRVLFYGTTVVWLVLIWGPRRAS